jgi:ADP-dependent NAD(P)H-hydrate dehydratase / NAD(P)H-hydrate epimerase
MSERARRRVFGLAALPLPTAAESAAADRAARERAGVPERVLMENAGRAAALVVAALFRPGRVAVLAGGGNNGGDALVVARTLRTWGHAVTVFGAASRAPAAELAHGWDVTVATMSPEAARLDSAAVIVDGVLGTGTRGAPRAAAAEWIEAANASGRPIVALDLPSGVDATTGRVPGAAIRAAATVTFGWPKVGLLLHPARAHCGRLLAVEIGFPPLDAIDGAQAEAITPAWAAERLPARPPDAHKGTAGRLLILAGSAGMAGAAALAGVAARRAGAGLVRIASAEANRAILQSLVPEATFLDRTQLADADVGSMDGLAAGPGLGTDDVAWDALTAALAATGTLPMLLDADALNLLAREPDRLRALAGERPVVITPHPREMARLLAVETEAVTADAPAAAREAAARFGCTVLLKGQPSLIATPGTRLLVNTSGSSDLATGGMGDQLSGVIGAFLAAGLDARTAAGVGLFLSGRAADLCGLGRSLGPRDVSETFARALADPGARRPPRGLPFVTFDQPARW